jgi:hypothetical protein
MTDLPNGTHTFYETWEKFCRSWRVRYYFRAGYRDAKQKRRFDYNQIDCLGYFDAIHYELGRQWALSFPDGGPWEKPGRPPIILKRAMFPDLAPNPK